MKVVYCIHSVYNPGGMERVLLNKVRWLAENTDWEIMVVTTNQRTRSPFYSFPDRVRFVDLGINYSADGEGSPFQRIFGYLRNKKIHRRKLTDLLMAERPDTVVSLYPSESSFIPKIKDGSRKVLELHFNRFFRLQYGRKGIIGFLDRVRTYIDKRIASRFDDFVVLTEEDRTYWRNMRNISVIPNAALKLGEGYSDCSPKQVIAVGRLDYQKGFDRLISAWHILQSRYPQLLDWKLNIYGQGEWEDMLKDMIFEFGVSETVEIHHPVKDIADKYKYSSVLVMSSNYEGFPMVMIEGMGMGLPVVSFDFKCGPKDIITPGVDGEIVSSSRPDSTVALAETLAQLMMDDEKRKRMGVEARKVVERYSEEKVMKQWLRVLSR